MDLILLDSGLNVASDPIDDVRSLMIERCWDKHGSFSVTIGEARFDAARAATYLYADGETFRISEMSCERSVSLEGEHINALLDDVVVLEAETLRGNLEVCVRMLVSKYALTGGQQIEKLTLGALAGYTETIDEEVGPGSLSDILYELLEGSGMSYRITYDYANDALIFDVLKGLDRTQTQSVNAWATFSTSFENLENPSYAKNTRDYKNFAYVVHEKDGVVTTVEVDRTDGEPRRSLYLKASGVKEEDIAEYGNEWFLSQLRQQGLKALKKYGRIESMSGRINQSVPPKYGEGYEVGDIVDIVDGQRNLAESKRVTAVRRVFEPEGIRITPTFGETYLSLREFIKREVRNV